MILIKLVFNIIWLMVNINKDFTKRTESDKVLRDEAFKIASNPKYNGYQRGLASMIFKIFGKKSSSGRGIKSMPNQLQLASEIHKPIIRKFKRRSAYSSFAIKKQMQ